MRARTAVRRALPVAAAAAWPFVEPHLPVLRRTAVRVLPPGIRPIRVLHLSDLHLLPRHRRRAAWIRDLARVQPDLVVSTGDHISSLESIPLLSSTLGSLTGGGAVPAVFVPGNNDYYTPVPPTPLAYLTPERSIRRGPDLPWPDVARALDGVGWTDATHRRVPLEIAGHAVLVTGADDGHLRRDRYGKVAGRVPDGMLGIGVIHTPARRLLDAFRCDGYRLVLAGHTHGGQLRLPLAGAVVTNCDLERSRARGLSRLGGETWLHVSAGLGTSPYAPVRLCCRPEATLLELLPVAA